MSMNFYQMFFLVLISFQSISALKKEYLKNEKPWKCRIDLHCQKYVDQLNLPQDVNMENLFCMNGICQSKNMKEKKIPFEMMAEDLISCIPECESDNDCNEGKFPSGVEVVKKFKCRKGKCLVDGKQIKLESCRRDADCNYGIFPAGVEILNGFYCDRSEMVCKVIGKDITKNVWCLHDDGPKMDVGFRKMDSGARLAKVKGTSVKSSSYEYDNSVKYPCKTDEDCNRGMFPEGVFVMSKLECVKGFCEMENVEKCEKDNECPGYNPRSKSGLATICYKGTCAKKQIAGK